jgi:ubiquinone/menaquinone biosynthesis C-methylase UbiE
MNAKATKDEYGSQSVYYKKYYSLINVRGSGLGAKVFQKLHKAMESPYRGGHYGDVLEIGAGTGEHLDFIGHSYDRYYLTDIRLPVLPEKWKKDPEIFTIEANAEKLPFEDAKFDRIISTCLLHHVEKPEKVLEEILRLLKPNGVAMIYLTCDPGFMTRLIRRLTSERAAKRVGFEGFKLFMAREHRNHVGGLLEMGAYVFRNRKMRKKWLPFRIPSWNLNGSVIIHIT